MMETYARGAFIGGSGPAQPGIRQGAEQQTAGRRMQRRSDVDPASQFPQGPGDVGGTTTEEHLHVGHIDLAQVACQSRDLARPANRNIKTHAPHDGDAYDMWVQRGNGGHGAKANRGLPISLVPGVEPGFDCAIFLVPIPREELSDRGHARMPEIFFS
jgi:hypothetical protein